MIEYDELNNYYLMSLSDYINCFDNSGNWKGEFKYLNKKRIFLNCKRDEYLKYLIEIKESKSKITDSLITKMNSYFYNYKPCIISIDSDDLQTGKSISAVQLAMMYNNDFDFKKYVRFDFSDIADLYKELYHKVIIQDEIQNSASRFISNIQIEIIQALLTTYGDRNNILITTSGNYDILTIIKRFVRIRIHFIERGLADVYYPVTNINSYVIRYKKIDTYRFLPLPIEIHEEYYKLKHEFVDTEIEQRIKRLREYKQNKLFENSFNNMDIEKDILDFNRNRDEENKKEIEEIRKQIREKYQNKD